MEIHVGSASDFCLALGKQRVTYKFRMDLIIRDRAMIPIVQSNYSLVMLCRAIDDLCTTYQVRRRSLREMSREMICMSSRDDDNLVDCVVSFLLPNGLSVDQVGNIYAFISGYFQKI